LLAFAVLIASIISENSRSSNSSPSMFSKAKLVVLSCVTADRSVDLMCFWLKDRSLEQLELCAAVTRGLVIVQCSMLIIA